ncbi:C6 transcription factor [Pleurostoma richardsiae]|uniref:C6 transcription factor n=1 Tax=Pleurostoma richardsiae TaxID=41990 RepID=A0AA38VIW4_9PEZI|nr:C6 transcription factor [Pleurostoma richardsiae]
MDGTGRLLTRRYRAALACNACRKTKSKCDGERPACGRCARQSVECLYTQNVRDKRIERQEERRAHFALKNRVNELEARLAATSSPRQTIDEPEDRPSPAQVSNAGVSDTGSRGTNAESAVDILATGAFDHRPAAEIGYFGPTSNHALFRSLTAAMVNSGHRLTLLRQQESDRQHVPVPEPPRPRRTLLPGRTSALDRPTNEDPFPGPLTAIQWVTAFFDTVGAVLPYVNESALLREVDTAGSRLENSRTTPRSVEALLNIVFAHALIATSEADSAEPFYHRAIALVLLDEQTVCNSTLETVQALLLLGSFQQNTQRAMASLTTHALAVKTSYQLGLHSPSCYEGLGTLEKELRAKLWFAVVNQDRILSTALGRPCLIPPHYVRNDILDSLVPLQSSRTVAMPSSMESLLYFRHLTSLHEIMGITVESIYGSNIGSPSDLLPGDLTAKTIELLFRLQKWRDSISPFCILGPKSDLSTWPASRFQSERYMLLLSIYYHKTMMLASAPVLMAVLERATDYAAADDAATAGILQDASVPVLKSDLHAIREYQRIASSILRHRPAFFKSNAVWWVCNFICLTMCLHLFAIWLISILSERIPSAIGVTSSTVETLLLEALDTLKSVGGSSMMSLKAHRCLHRYIRLARVIASDSSRRQSCTTGSVGSDIFHDLQQNSLLPSGVFLWDGFPDASMTSVGDLFGQHAENDFLAATSLGVEPGASSFDATGLVFDGTI